MPTDFKRVIDDLSAVLAEANQIRSEVREVPRVRTSRRWADPGDDEVRTYTAKNDEDIARANSLLLSALGKYAPRNSGHVENGRRVVRSTAYTTKSAASN